jgi:glycosyltransferase involved in cell wall biosynthesis
MPIPGEHVLVVTHTFPPEWGIGGRRWAKFAKALAHRGWTVHVICAETPDGNTISPWTPDVQHPGIVVHTLPRLYPQVITRWPITRLVDKLAYRFWMHALPLLCKGNHLDTAVLWRKQFLRKAGELIDTHGIRNVIVSGAPFRLLVDALELRSARPRLHLVGDLRDPWTWGHLYGLPNLPKQRFAQEQAMEQAVIAGFDAIMSPGLEIIEHLHAAYPQHAAKCKQLQHVLDPDDLPVTMPRKQGPPRQLIYAGAWYGTDEAVTYLNGLIDAFRAFSAKHPERAREVRFDLYVTANDTRKPEALVRAAGLSDRIRFHAPLPAKEILERIAHSDAAVVFTPDEIKDVISTKFNELFHLRIPVIHVGGSGSISALIEEHRLGCSIRVAELATELPALLAGDRPLEVDRSYDTGPVLLERITDRLVSEFMQ